MRLGHWAVTRTMKIKLLRITLRNSCSVLTSVSPSTDSTSPSNQVWNLYYLLTYVFVNKLIDGGFIRCWGRRPKYFLPISLLRIHSHRVKANANFFFNLCRCWMWESNWISLEEMSLSCFLSLTVNWPLMLILFPALDVNVCETNNTCRNGTCVYEGFGQFHCNCYENYTGSMCQCEYIIYDNIPDSIALTKNTIWTILIFGGHQCGSHWYPCFGLLVTSPLDFKTRVDPSVVCFMTCMQ